MELTAEPGETPTRDRLAPVLVARPPPIKLMPPLAPNHTPAPDA